MKKLYSASIKLTFTTTVEVEAESAEEATELFKRGEWTVDNLAGAELSDWSDPRGVKEER